MAEPKTVLVTGITGYIAKHVALRLLETGHRVVGTLRRPDRGEEVLAALRPHVSDPDSLSDRLRFVGVDLTADAGWDTAFENVDALIHTASPFPIAEPDDEQDLIRPAVDGALRALRHAHAHGIERVILTSSAAAIVNSELAPGKSGHDESDWTDLDHPGSGAYVKSKTLAERAAWDFQRNEAPGMALTAINPVLVLGPPLDRHYGSSVGLIERLLRGKDPVLPNFGMSIVDVRDVAEMHVRALERPDTAGKRFIASSGFLWFREVAGVVKSRYPDRKIATRAAPDFLVRLMAVFDRSIRVILPHLGRRMETSSARARTEMDMRFIPAEKSVTETAEFLVDRGLV